MTNACGFDWCAAWSLCEGIWQGTRACPALEPLELTPAPLERDAGAVAAGVGAAGQDAALGVGGDAVAAADLPGPLIQDVDLVAARPQPIQGVGRDAGLGVHQGPLEGPDPRGFDGGLDVHAEVEFVDEHLERGLEDAERAGRADP